MKRILLILAMFLTTIPVAAQTTTTTCQVIGNQIFCTTAPPTPPVALVAPQLRQQIPSPEEARERALKLQALEAAANAPAAEAMRREVERFAAELSSHDVWISMKTGAAHHLHMSAGQISMFVIPPPGATWTASIACTPGRDSSAGWACKKYVQALRFNETQMFRKNKRCTFEFGATLTSVALDRIEMTYEYAEPKDVDWGQCKLKKMQTGSTTLIPRN